MDVSTKVSYEFVDPTFLRRFTYIDKEGRRRIKNPYKNRKTYTILVNKLTAEGSFVYMIREDMQSKVLTVAFPGKEEKYEYDLDLEGNKVTFKNIPMFTYIDITIIDPKPIPKSSTDLIWDDLTYESQKSLIAAWGDLEMLCNAIFDSMVDSEFEFDDQNTLKWGLIAEKNNCNNVKMGVHDRLVVPPNGVYNPPILKPDTPPDPPSEPTTEPVKVVVCPKEIVEVGYIEIPEDPPHPLEIIMEFSEINSSAFPDLNVKAPNGNKFGYTWTYLSKSQKCATNDSSSCSFGSYTGYGSHPEIMRFNEPIEGKWTFYAQSWGGDKPSLVEFSSNYPVNVTYKKHNCPGFPDIT